jgi:uncharacterized DUF497 family protein
MRIVMTSAKHITLRGGRLVRLIGSDARIPGRCHIPRIKRLLFDDANTEHIARHAVEPEEVEEACLVAPMLRRGKSGRLAVYGRTMAGRRLLVVLAPKGAGDYYVITARNMTRTEQRRYHQAVRRQG